MIAPPRTTECLLGALGAGDRVREPLLGDLAEEFARRVERDGEPAACAWYRREAARAVPHLLRAWVQSMDGRAIRRQANILFAAWFLTGVLAFVLIGLVSGVLWATGASMHVDTSLLRAGDPVACGKMLAVIALMAIVGGRNASSLDVSAPLASAVSLGVVWSLLGLVSGILTSVAGRYAGPEWFRVAELFIMLTGPVIGGLLHVRAARGASPVVAS